MLRIAPRFMLFFLLAAMLYPAGRGSAQQRLPWRMVFWQEDFTTFDSTRYVIGRDASWDTAGGYFRLTPEATGMAGRLWYVRPHSPAYFEATFRMHLGYNSAYNWGGADGIIFGFAPFVNYPSIDGGSMDFDGCEGFGVEFDTYFNAPNNDPSKEHIAVVGPLTKNHLAYNTNVKGKLLTGAWHDAKISMRNGAVDVTMDGVTYLSYTIPNFPAIEEYFGFTSGTGAAFNQHLVDDIKVVVPASASLRFATMNLCERRSIETTLVVINNTILPLILTDARVDDILDPGAFEIVAFSPATLQPNDSILVRLRLRAPFPGDKLSLFKLVCSNGETLVDTLRAVVTAPEAELSTDSLLFPPTHVGFTADRSITLRNRGSAPLEIANATFSGSAGAGFTLLRPAIPFTLQPGDSIELRIRFEPRTDSLHAADLRLTSPCIQIPLIPCAGTGVIRTLRIDVAVDTALRPYSKFMLPIMLLDSPAGTGVTSFSADLSYNPAVFRINNLVTAGTISAGAQVTTAVPLPGVYRIQVRFVDTLRTAGQLFAVEYESIASDTGCSSVGFDRFDFNYLSRYPGVPRSAPNNGWICVSPSCRTPEGFVPVARITTSRIERIVPNPVNPTALIYIRVGDVTSGTPSPDPSGLSSRHISLRLYDLLGRSIANVFDGDLTSGEHAILFDSNGLGTGRYTLLLRDGGDITVSPLTILR